MNYKYYSSLKTTTNKMTGKIYYYVKKCDVFTRISKGEYWERSEWAIRSDGFLTTSNSKFTYQFKTIYFN